MESIGNICSTVSSFFGSFYSFLWSMIIQLGFWKCLLIIACILIWCVWEILAKATHSYNSENGFTPVFNSFIGATTYFWLQALTNTILEFLFTDTIYCMKWPYGLHLAIFLLTGFLLNITGVWSYWKVFGRKVRLR